METAAPKGYMPQLDGIRAFAVGSVALSHWVPSIYHLGLPWGSAGVQIFFVLSGFLITGILLRCREYNDVGHSLKSFYMRRFLRIFPLYYATLLVLFLLNFPQVREAIGWHLTYFSNFLFFSTGEWSGHVSHFWSLAVEEQFYLLWPALILLVPEKYLARTIKFTIAIGIFSRFGSPLLFPGVKMIGTLPTSNLDALGLGALIAFKKCNYSKTLRYTLFCCIPAYFLLFIFRHGVADYFCARQLERTVMLLAFGWIILTAAEGFKGPAGKLLVTKPMLYIGKISYGIYVIHNFAEPAVELILNSLGAAAPKNFVIALPLYAVFTLSLASLSWHLFESPLNGIKSRFPYRKTRAS